MTISRLHGRSWINSTYLVSGQCEMPGKPMLVGTPPSAEHRDAKIVSSIEHKANQTCRGERSASENVACRGRWGRRLSFRVQCHRPGPHFLAAAAGRCDRHHGAYELQSRDNHHRNGSNRAVAKHVPDHGHRYGWQKRAANPTHVQLPQGAKSFHSGEVEAGEVWPYTFDVRGIYRYLSFRTSSKGCSALS